MSRPLIKIHNAETNEIMEREMNEAEFTEYEKDIFKLQADKENALQLENAKKALLEKLGLTEEEAKLLLS